MPAAFAPANVDTIILRQNSRGGYHWEGGGGIFERLVESNGDVGVLRPFKSDDLSDDRSFITVNRFNPKLGKMVPTTLVTNAPASLRFQDWRLIDEAILRVYKPRLQFVGDLRAANLETAIPNGMAYTVLSYENMSDISGAQISMEGTVMSEGDRPVFDMVNMPLPIIHKDFSYSLRQVLASRNGQTPLDTTTAEMAAERVAESAEMLALGVLPSYTFGGGTIYGVTNYPGRMTKTMTAPTAVGWTPGTAVSELLAMISQARAQFHNGPYMVYVSPNWVEYIGEDYILSGGNVATQTLAARLAAIPGIAGIKTLDYLNYLPNKPFVMLLVQMDKGTIRVVVAMEIVTLQWDSQGGMQKNYKVMCIILPQIRSDQNGNTGIVHGSASSGGTTVPVP